MFLCGALVLLASTRMPEINKGREALNVMGAESPLENAPPGYALWIQAFGAFRGLIVDIAFIRADQYKEQARYYDAMNLATWICHLQPHFPSVWEFAAWNMSWNISVTTYTAEERWNWVYNGVKLLRDEGIPFNPRAINLYKQLAWTFNNKMGEVTDDFHYSYKCYWAWRMHLLLGAPASPLALVDPYALSDETEAEKEGDLLEAAARKAFAENEEKRRKAAEERGDTYVPMDLGLLTKVADREAELAPGIASYEIAKRAARERLAAIDAAPKKLAEVYERYPDAEGMVRALRELGIVLNDDTLSEDTYWRSDGLAFTFFAPYRTVTDGAGMRLRVLREDQEEDAWPWQTRGEELDKILGIRAHDPAGIALVEWLQKKVLLEAYRLETEHMLRVVDEFGPVDWRSVDAHSLYWVTRGLVAAGETFSSTRNDRANTVRIMFFSLRNLLLRNHIVFEPYPPHIDRSYMNFSQDLNFIEPMHQAYLKYGALFDPRAGSVGGAGDTYRIGHANFLAEAIRYLYIAGRESEAAYYFDYLRTAYGLNEAGEINPAYEKSLRDFVMDDFLERMEYASQRDIRLILGGFFSDAYNELAMGDVRRYHAVIRRARELYDEYMKDKRTRMGQSKALVDFIDVQCDSFRDELGVPGVVPYNTIAKARLWRAAPLYLRQAVYDELLEVLTAECDAWGFDVTRAFPEPKGMEDYRVLHPTRHRESREDAIDSLPMKTGSSTE